MVRMINPLNQHIFYMDHDMNDKIGIMIFHMNYYIP
jgi:hypothetical protein